MKHLKSYLYIILSVCLGFACNGDQNTVAPTGILYLNVTEDATLFTKADREVESESLQVTILQGEEDTLKVYNDYLKEVKGKRLILPVGKYTIAVRSNGADGVAWETPLYAGKEEVEVKQGEITNIKVICTIANTKVSVVYSDDLKERFTDYQTNVSNPSGFLNFTRDEYRSGFFTPEKLTVRLNLVNKDGNEFTIKKVYPNIEPKYHYVFEFTIGSKPTDDEAGADFDITVDENSSTVTYNIFIKEESLTNIGEPIGKIEGFNDGVYIYNMKDEGNPEPDPISLLYMLGKNNTLQSFKVTVNSPTNPHVKGFDLTKEDDRSLAASIGFPERSQPTESSDNRYNAYRMDLTKIVSKLGSVDEKPTLHTFTVDIVDDKFQEASITFAIQMMPDVDALANNPVCWSTFVVLKGVCLDETSYFKFQTEDDENSIKDIKAIIRGKDGTMSALVIGLVPGKKYKYWIVSEANADLKSTPCDILIKESSEVPNLSFDAWSTLKGKGPISDVDYTSPNASANDVFWESGNLGAAAAGKTVTQSTDIVATKLSKHAAKLSSLRAEMLGMGAFAAGSIYSGYPKSVSTSGAELKYGRQYSKFPTHLRGYYRYDPGIINNEYNAEISGGSDKDQCYIYIALSIKNYDLQSKCPIKQSGIDKINVIPFDKNDPNIFAYGEYVSQKTENLTGKEDPNIIEGSGYAPFDITLKYRKGKMPTEKDQVYIILVATSSKAGDYFTGSTSSVLYVDEFSLDYDYDAASFVGTEFESMSPININDK